MKLCVIISLFLMFFLPLKAEKNVTLSQLIYPKSILIKGDNLIVTEKTSVTIYSLTDFKFRANFGNAGEGPEEYMISNAGGFPSIRANVNDTNILVTSMGKISFYSLDGFFEKETKIPTDFLDVKSVGNQYAVWIDSTDEKGTRYAIINIVDPKFNKVKEISKTPFNFSQKDGLFFYKLSFAFHTTKDKIFVLASNDFLINVFDSNGKKLYTINHEIQKQTVTQEDIDSQLTSLKLEQPEIFDYFKGKMFFPEKFPSIRDFKVIDDKIYVFTYNTIKTGTECLILDLKGKLIKKIMVILNESAPRKWYPYAIKNDKLYQIVENEQTEDWELVVSVIK